MRRREGGDVRDVDEDEEGGREVGGWLETRDGQRRNGEGRRETPFQFVESSVRVSP